MKYNEKRGIIPVSSNSTNFTDIPNQSNIIQSDQEDRKDEELKTTTIAI